MPCSRLFWPEPVRRSRSAVGARVRVDAGGGRLVLVSEA